MKSVLYSSRHLLAVVLLIGLSGCVSVNRVTEGSQTAFGGRIAFTAPINWVRYDYSDQPVILTRDGSTIQSVTLAMGPVAKVLPKTKPAVDASRLPQEVGDMVLAERRALLGDAPLKVKEVVPAMIGGAQGFRARASYRNERGAPYELMIAGAMVQDSLVVVSYQALAVHFFERDMPAVEGLLASLNVR
jgi:hypothetical protein